MPIGPGKYDDIATELRERTKAKAVIPVIVDGNRSGSGFCVQAPAYIAKIMPSMLRTIANEMEKDLRANDTI